ncbi:MAG: 4-(cytidine 5'-diphospho)-2-C-methyl-D-erythritol kinase [Thermodesulfobacteriota bacterium]
MTLGSGKSRARTRSTYTIKAPAKLNLRLKVTGVRPDGYHELVSVMVPVSLFDVLELTVAPPGVMQLTCDGYAVPGDENNLVWKAVAAFSEKAGVDTGYRIRLLKNIPVAAGLGGGSSDAAAVLLCLNEARGKPLSGREIHLLAAGLGADVPFFLSGRPSLARGIGEILEPLRGWPRHHYVIVTPRLRVSTAWVYGRLRLNGLTRDEYHYIMKQLSSDSFVVAHILENDLETVTSASFPIIETIKRELLDAGAAGALMTGSGPSVFGLFDSPSKASQARQAVISRDLGDAFVATEWERPSRESCS